MKRVLSIFIPFIFTALFPAFFSCTNYNEQELFGEVECDTTDITWQSTIADIMADNCVECHNSTFAYKNVRHDSYEEELIVVNDGRLRKVINHEPGVTPMPFERGKLPDCELLQINIWLDNGAPEK